MARDVLSIPATGAGVERLFNSARDICHYRRGSLKSSTIQELMMFMCTEKFDIEEQQLAFLREYRTREENDWAVEEEQVPATQDDLEPISDNEENSSAPTRRTTSQPSSNKRQRRAISSRAGKQHEQSQVATVESDDDDDDTGNVPLPNQQNTLQRASGRARKVPKTFEGFDVSQR